MDLHTDDLRLFARCVSEGSVSAAARTLGLPQAAASRRLQRLEAAVGAPLLHRTTRALRPTAEGERLLPVARAVLGELAGWERASAVTRAEATGDVRVSAPVLLGQVVGSTLAAALAQRHPGLRLVLSLSNARVDLVRDGVDLALRVGPLPSASLRATRVATAHVGAYVRRDLAPEAAEHPRALVDLPWIGAPQDRVLRATGPAGEAFSAPVAFRFVCDDRGVLRDAACAGLGAALLPTFLGDAEPGLTRLAPAWQFGRVPIRVVCLREARGDPRVRAVIEVVAAWGRERAW